MEQLILVIFDLFLSLLEFVKLGRLLGKLKVFIFSLCTFNRAKGKHLNIEYCHFSNKEALKIISYISMVVSFFPICMFLP